MNEYNHEQARQALLREADGLLDADQAAVLQQHLESCAGCRAEQAELIGVEGALRETFREHARRQPLPPLESAGVLAGGAAIRRATREQRMILAAAVMALFLLVWMVGAGAWSPWPPDQLLRIDKTRPATLPSPAATLAAAAPSPTPTVEPIVEDWQGNLLIGRLIEATPGPKDG